MSVRVSESWTARNGRRRSVSMGLGTYAAASLYWCTARGIAGLLALPFVLTWWVLLFDAWICAELAVFIVTGIAVIAAVARKQARGADITFRMLRWHLLAFGLKGARV